MRNSMRALPMLAAAAAAIVLPASAAHAADRYDRCPDGYYCMFSGLDGTGDMIKLRGSTPDLVTLGMNDRAKSDWNRTASTIYLWSDANYAGCTATTSAGPAGKGNFFPAYRDFFSSVQFDGPGGPSCGTPPGGDGQEAGRR
ncbi:peptidase inhibitor family I36 protein [Streptomyces sp. NPDC021096]|uniref:peptidase inhibitor family I36 protein n=1 Tax=Streptomyces sp. NPDC021096 TaxID=3154792 RepID=UPI0034027018